VKWFAAIGCQSNSHISGLTASVFFILSAAHHKDDANSVITASPITRAPNFFKVASRVDATGHIPPRLVTVFQKSGIFPLDLLDFWLMRAREGNIRFASEKCPLLARSGHTLVHRTFPLSGGKADAHWPRAQEGCANMRMRRTWKPVQIATVMVSLKKVRPMNNDAQRAAAVVSYQMTMTAMKK
jgi:hypothetical protein